MVTELNTQELNLTDFASYFNTQMSQAKEPMPEGALEAGEYTVQITDARIAQTQGRDGSTRRHLDIVFKVVGPAEGPFYGHSTHMRQGLNSPEAFGMLKAKLRRLGIQGNDFESCMGALRDLIGSIWNITSKPKDGFANYYWNRRIMLQE